MVVLFTDFDIYIIICHLVRYLWEFPCQWSSPYVRPFYFMRICLSMISSLCPSFLFFVNLLVNDGLLMSELVLITKSFFQYVATLNFLALTLTLLLFIDYCLYFNIQVRDNIKIQAITFFKGVTLACVFKLSLLSALKYGQ